MTAAFWERVDRRGPDECWPWRLSPSGKDGYGLFWGAGSVVYAHRYSAMIAAGRTSLATTEFVIHSCDNPPCCNPSHLSIADHAANMADMVERDRSIRCDGKLTFADAESIRREYAGGGQLQREIADRYDIAQQTVSDIVNEKILTQA